MTDKSKIFIVGECKFFFFLGGGGEWNFPLFNKSVR